MACRPIAGLLDWQQCSGQTSRPSFCNKKSPKENLHGEKHTKQGCAGRVDDCKDFYGVSFALDGSVRSAGYR